MSSTKKRRSALPNWLSPGYITLRFSRAVSRAIKYAGNDSGSYLQKTQQLAGDMSTGDNTTNRTEEITGFFKLPRELRDMIYDLLCVDNTTTCVAKSRYWGEPNPPATITTRRTILNAFLLNRRFKSEFEERPAARENNTTLTSYSSLRNFKTMVYPKSLQVSTDLVLKIEFHRTCDFCGGQWVLDLSELKEIPRLAELMPNLRTIYVHHHFRGLTFRCDQEQDVLSDHWTWSGGGLIDMARFAAGGSKCWRSLPGRASAIPSIDVSWYSLKAHGTGQPLRFAKWTEGDGLQFEGEVEKRCKDTTGYV